MDSIYKILESLDKVSENKESGVKVTNIKWKAEPGVDLPSSVKLNISAPIGTDNDKMWELVGDKLEDNYGYTVVDYDMQFEESIEEGRYDGPNSSCCDAPIQGYDKDTKLGICSACKDHASPHEDEEELEEGQYDGKSREELMKMKADAEASMKNMKSSGDSPQQKFYDETQMMMAQQHLDSINDALKKVGESVEEAEITPIDHSGEEDGASAEDIASAITRRMMAHPKFGSLVREVDIIDLNDAIEEIAQFHKGGDLGTSDVSNMVNDVLKQLKKEGALSEEEVNEEEVEEGNEFTEKRLAAIKAGKDSFEVDGKSYKVTGDTSDEKAMSEDEDSMPASPDEGGMAGDQAEFIKYAVDEIKDHIENGGDFPEWFQNKMSDVYGKMKDLHGYMEGDKRNDAEQEAEAEEVEETTVAGSVATTATGEGIFKNASVYESMNSKVENIITESMSVNVSSSTEGEPSVSVSATGEDALALAQLLQLARVESNAQPCESCGRVHEGSCMNEDEEANSAKNTQTYDMHYLLNAISGGLNGQKRQINPNNPGDNPMAMSAEKVVNIEESEDTTVSHLESLYKEFKAK